MWWFNWKRTPPPTTHFIFLFCLCISGVLQLSFSPRLVCFLRFFFFFAVALDIYSFFKLHRSVFLHWAHHNNFSPFCPFIISPSIFSTLYFYAFISASLQWFPSFPAHSYAIFCFAWRIHLACGCLGSDGYISWEGGLSGESLPSPIHNGLCACWCRLSTGSEPVDLGSPLGYWAAVSTLPGHSLGWQAPTQARGVSQPSGCHRWCLSCAVVSFPQTVVIRLGSSHLSKPPSYRRQKNDWHLLRQDRDSCGCDRTKQSRWPSTCCVIGCFRSARRQRVVSQKLYQGVVLTWSILLFFGMIWVSWFTFSVMTSLCVHLH